MNPWHDIDAGRINADKFVAVTEIAKGSRQKYEIDKESGMLMIDRILATSMRYPANYGFIPKTLSEDGDPLDVLIICSEEIAPMTLAECVTVGVIEMIDGGERDEKIIAVLKKDPYYGHITEINQLPENALREIDHFLRVYKGLEKDIDVAVHPVKGREEAMKIINEAKVLYAKTFAGK